MARYCPGLPGRGVELPALRLEPGKYLVAVLQDMDRYQADEAPFVHENVSDTYALMLGPASEDIGVEREPNETAQASMPLTPGTEIRASLAFVRDVDVFCAAATTTGKVRFIVREPDTRPRDAGLALEVTALGGPRASTPIQLHRAAAGKLGPTHVLGTLTTDAIDTQNPGGSACVQVRVAVDTLAVAPPRVPLASPEPYVVKLETVP
jgi:hypothetical protein